MYKSYIHIEALNKYPDYLTGEVYITPKLDGTNACVYFENGEICAGSRKRAINIDSDNAGFALWLKTSKSEEACLLRSFFIDLTENQNLILYGEFGVGSVATIKRYIPGTASQFWIFDVYNAEENCFISRKVWEPILYILGLEPWIVPIMTTLNNPSYDEVVSWTEKNHFRLNEDDEPGEGIVIRNENYRDQYGHYIITKVIRSEFKVGKGEKQKEVKKFPDNLEAAIVNEYIVEADILKTEAKIALECGVPQFDKKNGKHIGMLLNYIYRDLLVEEMPYIVTKRYKNCTINFGTLHYCSDLKVRNYLFGV